MKCFRKTIPLATILDYVKQYGEKLSTEYQQPLQQGSMPYSESKTRKGKRYKKKQNGNGINQLPTLFQFDNRLTD